MSSIYGRLPVSGHYLQKRLRSPGIARRLAGFSLVLIVVGVAIYRLGSILPEALVGVLLLSGGLALISFIICLVGLARCWLFGIVGGGAAFGGLFLAGVALTPFLFLAYLGSTNPPTNAAYTEGLAPDEIAAAISTSGVDTAKRTGGVASAIADLPSVVPGRRYSIDAPRVFEASRAVLTDLGWTVEDLVVGDPLRDQNGAADDLGVSGSLDIPVPTFRADALAAEPGTQQPAVPDADRYSMNVVARDAILALPSDMVIRLVEDENETFVEVQSVSTVTGLDFGQNRRLIEEFLQRLDRTLTGLAKSN